MKTMFKITGVLGGNTALKARMETADGNADLTGSEAHRQKWTSGKQRGQADSTWRA
jgi:hypothetical protein